MTLKKQRGGFWPFDYLFKKDVGNEIQDLQKKIEEIERKSAEQQNDIVQKAEAQKNEIAKKADAEKGELSKKLQILEIQKPPEQAQGGIISGGGRRRGRSRKNSKKSRKTRRAKK